MMIIDSALRITATGRTVDIIALTDNGATLLPWLDKELPTTVKKCQYTNKTRKFNFPIIKKDTDEDTHLQSTSIFDCLRKLLKIQSKHSSEYTFLGGLFSYDLISSFESLPKLKKTSECPPDYCFYLSEILLIFDHQQRTCELQSIFFGSKNSEKSRLKKRLNQLKKLLNKKSSPIPYKKIESMTLDFNHSDLEYKKIIYNMKNAIRRGEIFQAVPSRKFYLPCPSPLAAYHELKKKNPSPYMFFMQDINFTLFGSSPESSLKYSSETRKIEIHPIAGTRARAYNNDGTLNIDLDNRIELEMRLNKKELSEHLMLVDLARNDLARVCVPGSRYVSDLLKVDRYRFVMHLVSSVIGTLHPNLDALHAYRACMNMGTLTGAPKIKAMQLIYEMEGERRGTYGGSIGYLTGKGNLNMCIIIRAAYVTNNIATIQAGAGIVIDSIPQEEADESRNKAKAVLHAIASAHLSKGIF